jgi:hypothetical protein
LTRQRDGADPHGQLECRLTECVSPEDGALIQRLELTSHRRPAPRDRGHRLLQVALGAQSDMEAHPRFKTSLSAPPGRTARSLHPKAARGGAHPMLIYALAAEEPLRTATKSIWKG